MLLVVKLILSLSCWSLTRPSQGTPTQKTHHQNFLSLWRALKTQFYKVRLQAVDSPGWDNQRCSRESDWECAMCALSGLAENADEVCWWYVTTAVTPLIENNNKYLAPSLHHPCHSPINVWTTQSDPPICLSADGLQHLCCQIVSILQFASWVVSNLSNGWAEEKVIATSCFCAVLAIVGLLPAFICTKINKSTFLPFWPSWPQAKYCLGTESFSQ